MAIIMHPLTAKNGSPEYTADDYRHAINPLLLPSDGTAFNGLSGIRYGSPSPLVTVSGQASLRYHQPVGWSRSVHLRHHHQYDRATGGHHQRLQDRGDGGRPFTVSWYDSARQDRSIRGGYA